MPASQFFVMYEVAKKLSDREMVRACWASRASALTADAFMTLVSKFSEPAEIDLPKPEKVSDPKLISEKREHERYAVMSAFAADNTIDRRVKVIH